MKPLRFDGFGINDSVGYRVVTFPNALLGSGSKLYGPLLAAAPELLDAAKEALKDLELAGYGDQASSELLRAVIAKAEGKTI